MTTPTIAVPVELLERISRVLDRLDALPEPFAEAAELRAPLTEQPQASAAQSAPATVATGNMREVLAMVLQALDRDAAEGRGLRGEMAAELRAAMEAQSAGVPGTPGASWRANGEPDPHGDRYNCERAALAMGDLTDDELANGAFMNYDRPLNIEGILAGTHSSPIAWMTAVKDRIRWLSRKLDEALAAATAQPAAQEQHPDDEAVDRFAVAMKAKLAKSREKGRHGWQTASAAHLSGLLYRHMYKADPLDVANLAMMLHQNGQAIELPQEARHDQGEVQRLREALEEIRHANMNGPVSESNAGCIKRIEQIAERALAASTGQEV